MSDDRADLIPVDHDPFADPAAPRWDLASALARTGQPPAPAPNVPSWARPATMDELSQPGRDAIRVGGLPIPMGNMTTDPTGLIGAAKGVAYLPAAIEDHRARIAAMRAAGAPEDQIAEADKDNPAYNAAFQLLAWPIAGKVLGTGAAVAPEAASTFGRMIRDESGTLRLPGAVSQDAGAAAAAPRSGLIRNSDFDTILPVENRRVGPYQEGVGTVPVAGGADWTDLDMSKSIGGMKASPEDLQKAWGDAVQKIRDWSPEQAAQIDKYLSDHPEVGPNTWKFWNDALSQPQKMRYWYELGTRKFQSEGLDKHPEDFSQTMDMAAATSPSAEPLQNLQRTVGTLAENQQGQPVATDLIQPGAARMAFTTGMEAPKTTNYTGTFKHIAGVDDKPPISVNDRQHGEILGMDPNELAKRPDLYALASQFTQNLRDAENAARPGVAAGTENPFESWQIQAPGWTHYRGTKSAAKVGVSDDYADVMDKRIKPQLEAAGIDTSPGLFSREVLGNSAVPDLMSGTRAQYLASPTATVETATKMTPEGRQATDLLSRLPPAGPDAPSWANAARYGMEKVQRDSFRALTTGDKNSVISQLVAPVIGKQGAAVSRADVNGWGTYQGDISPNLRIPMWARTGEGAAALAPEHIPPVLSALGDAFGQEATPAAHFEAIEPGADTSGRPRTYSVFLPEIGPAAVPATTAQVQQFTQALGGHEVSLSRRPNGTLIDVHPVFPDQGPPIEPAIDQVAAATNSAFGQTHPGANIFDRAYSSHYPQHPSQNAAENYNTHIDDFWESQRNADNQRLASGLGSPSWGAKERLGAFEAARERARGIAADQRAATQAWIDKNQPRIEQYEANPAGARGRQLRPLAGIGAAGLAGAGYGALANPAQAGQPPPNLIPVDHDPFAGTP